MNRIVATLAIGVLALAFIGHLHGYAIAHTGKLVQSMIVDMANAQDADSGACDRKAVATATDCVSPRNAFVAHGVGSSCSFFAVPVSVEVQNTHLRGRTVHWSMAARRLLTVPIAPILRPPIFVS